MDLEEKARLEEVRQRQIAEVVASETKSMENRIRPEDIGRAVEEALASPVDYEYAIDTDGNMFRCELENTVQRSAKMLFPGCVTRLWGWGRVTQPRKVVRK